MLRPRVVTPDTLTAVLSRHPVLRDTDLLTHLSPVICGMAHASRVFDVVKYLLPAFDAWRIATPFHPKPTFAPNHTDPFDDAPVHEYARFGGRTFFRARHSLGVTFATIVPHDGGTGVAWTTARRAHLFQRRGDGWVEVETLEEQDVPFLTWMTHLGGREISERERRTGHPLTAYDPRPPQQLFHDLVVPLYGTTTFARSRLEMRRVHPHHPVWAIVRLASLRTVPWDDPARLEWHLL